MDSRAAFQQRILLAQPEEKILGMFFDYTLEAFTERFVAGAAESARGMVPREASGGWRGFFKYPVVDLLRLMDAGLSVAAQDEGPGYARALMQLGEAMAPRFMGTPLGKAFQLVSGRDLHGALSSSVSSARAASSFGERTYERQGPQRARLCFHNEKLGPAWLVGFYTEGIAIASGLRLRMEVEECAASGQDFVLRCSW